MQPILAQLALGDWSLTLRAYSTFLVAAAIVALVLAVRGAGRVGVPRRRALAVYAAAIVAGVVGARLLDVAFHVDDYAQEPGAVAAVRAAGFALYGGLAAAVLLVTVAARRWIRPSSGSAWTLADSAVPAVAAGIVLLRIGCFLNGCCAGVATDLPWGVTFPVGSSVWTQQILDGQTGILGFAGAVDPVHPTQLYEIGAALVCAAAATVAARRGAPPGVPALVFAAAFLLFRAADQVIRAPGPDAPVSWVLPALYLAGGCVAAAVLVRHSRERGARPAMRPVAATTVGAD